MNEQFSIIDAINRETTRELNRVLGDSVHVDRTAAAARRDLGIERAARKSGEDWQQAALDRLRMYLRAWELPFLTEDFSHWALANDFRPPHDGRAWGAVMQTAARRKLIRKVGYRAAKTSNLSPKVLWQRSY